VITVLRVFVSYSQREDQVLALRLQTLASTRAGLQVYVPPASTRGRGLTHSAAEIQELRDANLVLAIVGGTVSSTMQKELGLAQQLGKAIVPIALGDAKVTGLKAGQPVFHVDPQNPGESEHAIVEYLGKAHLSKSNVESAFALVLVAVGLLILGKK
jgi:hypothetical protein